MTRRPSIRRALLLVALLAAAGPAFTDPELAVTLLAPEPGTPVFGEVEVTAAVGAQSGVRRVSFFVDGRLVGERTAPPFTVRHDVGEANAEHRFEVEVEDLRGERVRAVLVTPPIRVDLEVELELQQLYVTVAQRGERLLDLAEEDFAVFDDGAAQRLVTFARGDVPLAALLLVDASDSMRGERLRAAVAGAEAFIAGMRPLDQVKLLLFADRTVHTTPFTNFAGVLRTGLGGVEAGGGTALNDHLYLALRLLEERQGRRVVVLLSDGVDVASVLRMREVLETARRSPALIYWLRLGSAGARGAHSSAWRDAAGHRTEHELLERAVEQSGGRVLTLGRVAETGAAFAQVLAELREQYVLGYYPTVNRGDGRWHEVEVRVRRRGVDVRTREGYFDF